MVYLGFKGFGCCDTTRINASIYKDLLNYKKSDEKDTIL